MSTATEKLCECGCGQPARRRFLPGHQMRSAAVQSKIAPSLGRRDTAARNRRIAERLRSGDLYDAVAEDYGISRQRVGQIARAAGIEPRRNGMGEESWSWRGGHRRTGLGYMSIYAPEHPRANANYVLEHILVAEQKLGRPLRSGEVVHHLNGVRDDNRPENLEVLTVGEHSRLHNLRYSEALLLDWLRWVALKVNHTPLSAQLREHLPVWFVTYHDRFGSYTKAAHQAGLTPNGRGGAGHGGTPLPLNFRKQYGHLLQYATPEALADALHGGLMTEHERNNAVEHGTAA